MGIHANGQKTYHAAHWKISCRMNEKLSPKLKIVPKPLLHKNSEYLTLHNFYANQPIIHAVNILQLVVDSGHESPFNISMYEY